MLGLRFRVERCIVHEQGCHVPKRCCEKEGHGFVGVYD